MASEILVMQVKNVAIFLSVLGGGGYSQMVFIHVLQLGC